MRLRQLTSVSLGHTSLVVAASDGPVDEAGPKPPLRSPTCRPDALMPTSPSDAAPVRVRDGLTVDVILAGAVFLVAYGLIASERVDRTLVALLGGLLVVVFGVITQGEAFAAIDFNVIFLLAGMMVLAGGLSKTGFFEYVAGVAIHFSRGQPFRLLIILALLTALLAAVLDNVTTVVLLTPVTLSIARTLKVNPFP